MPDYADPTRLTVACDGRFLPVDHGLCRGWIAAVDGWELCGCLTCRHDPRVAGNAYLRYMTLGNGIPRQRTANWTPGG